MVLPLAEINAFHVLGALFAAWAVLLAIAGFRRPGFPSGSAGQRSVIAISLVLMLAAVLSAVITSATESEHGDTEHRGNEPPADSPPGP
ncbi:MAG TPA: hypothetical protein VF520_03345 [Thermoleophilaceae bacterium]